MECAMNPQTNTRFWWVVLRPYFEWLCCWPILVLVAAMLVAIVWGYIGVEYGVPNLFWHEDQSTQILAGIGSAWLLGQLCFVGYLLAQNAEWMKNRSLRWYLLVTWLPLLVVLALRAVIRARGSDLFSETFNEIQRWPFVVGLAAGALSDGHL